MKNKKLGPYGEGGPIWCAPIIKLANKDGEETQALGAPLLEGGSMSGEGGPIWWSEPRKASLYPHYKAGQQALGAPILESGSMSGEDIAAIL